MSDIDKALERADSVRDDGVVVFNGEQTIKDWRHMAVLADAYRAEKEDNARLREAVGDAHRFLAEFKVESDEDSCMGKAYFKAHTSEDWYYILLDKLVSLTPDTKGEPNDRD